MTLQTLIDCGPNGVPNGVLAESVIERILRGLFAQRLTHFETETPRVPASVISDGAGRVDPSACRAALWTACQGVRSHPVQVALVGECSIPVV
jgi:hypothetical protein